ncbi:hypothetical protein [Shewanella marisflavi]|uniref:hypothetical protein n=1 Tax=Shewanella marisflavi TaxID=260364 RepID=UPI003AAEA857
MQNNSKSVFLREQLAPALDLYLDVLAAGDLTGAEEIYESKLMPLEKRLMHNHHTKIFEALTLNYFNNDCNTSDVLKCQEEKLGSRVNLGGSSARGSIAAKAYTLRRDLIEADRLASLRLLNKHFLLWVEQTLVDTFPAQLEDGTTFQRSHVFGETYSLLELYSPQKSRGDIAEGIDIIDSVVNQFAAYSDYELPVNYPFALRRHVETSLNKAMDRELHPSFYEFFGDGLSWASKPLFKKVIKDREFASKKYADFHAYDKVSLPIPRLKVTGEIAAFKNTSNDLHLPNHPVGFSCYALAKQACLNDLPLTDKDADFVARSVCAYIAVSGQIHNQPASDVRNALEPVLAIRKDFKGSHAAAIIATSLAYYPESNLTTQLIHTLQMNHKFELDNLCVIEDANEEYHREWCFHFNNDEIAVNIVETMLEQGNNNAYLRSLWVSTLLENQIPRAASTKTEMTEFNLEFSPTNSL